MSRTRRRHSAAFKAKVALEAAKGEQTAAQLASQYQVTPTQISTWKHKMLKELPQLFELSSSKADAERDTAPLYEEIGRLKMELDWLKKKLT